MKAPYEFSSKYDFYKLIGYEFVAWIFVVKIDSCNAPKMLHHKKINLELTITS